ncbi:hypothetical protein ACX0G9_23090 [Flavitalea flava]
MRFIDISRLKDFMGTQKYSTWTKKAKMHLSELRILDKKERSQYLSKHGDWTELYKYLSFLSEHKCWYTEAPENSGEWEIDHFRPKNRAKNLDGTIYLPDGYWWLAYEWLNYRLAGSFINKRRKDKFNPSEEIHGKGDYFPIDLSSCIACSVDGDLDDEVIYLLDPTSFRDTTLISFDKDGKPIPNYPPGTFEERKVVVSIDFLNLDTTVLNRNRKEVWENTEKEIIEVSKKLKSSTNQALRNKIYNDSFIKLKQLTSRKKPYSSVALNCLSANQNDNPWIISMLPHLN